MGALETGRVLVVPPLNKSCGIRKARGGYEILLPIATRIFYFGARVVGCSAERPLPVCSPGESALKAVIPGFVINHIYCERSSVGYCFFIRPSVVGGYLHIPLHLVSTPTKLHLIGFQPRYRVVINVQRVGENIVAIIQAIVPATSHLAGIRDLETLTHISPNLLVVI